MCASFNDWIPVEMKSLHEVKTEKEKGNQLRDFIKKCKRENTPELLESTKAPLNIIQNTQILPPGKHYMYFIYNRKHIFLSPGHSIVRFKGSNVYLNQVIVTQRHADELKKVTIKRIEAEDDG